MVATLRCSSITDMPIIRRLLAVSCMGSPNLDALGETQYFCAVSLNLPVMQLDADYIKPSVGR
jgi:hypothetical protein